MRFASAYYDKNKADLKKITTMEQLERYIQTHDIEGDFLKFAAQRDGLKPASKKEWEKTKSYLLPQLNALVGRYSQLGENAFYKMYMEIDRTISIAIEQ